MDLFRMVKVRFAATRARIVVNNWTGSKQQRRVLAASLEVLEKLRPKEQDFHTDNVPLWLEQMKKSAKDEGLSLLTWYDGSLRVCQYYLDDHPEDVSERLQSLFTKFMNELHEAAAHQDTYEALSLLP